MRIAVATTTRADWGLLSPLARELRGRGAELLVMAANMHFNPLLGMTVREIIADGFEPVVECKTQGSPAQIAAACLEQFSDAFGLHEPDCVICLGDRYEMLSIAQAAVMNRVPVVHIAGGAVSEGANDDLFRHAITKLSMLHLTECDQYRRRVISMGEDPARVIDTGAIGVHNILSLTPLSQEELAASIGFKVDSDTLLCTMHAATLDPVLSPQQQYDEMLEAAKRLLCHRQNIKILFTYPNNDVDPEPLVESLKRFAREFHGRVCIVPSLGMKRYLSALHYAAGVFGNSSSGIVEVPSVGIPVLDIGIRQQGRMRGPAVFHAAGDAASIEAGLEKILSPAARRLAAEKVNPYFRPDTLKLMADAIMTTPLAGLKTFYSSCDTSI